VGELGGGGGGSATRMNRPHTNTSSQPADGLFGYFQSTWIGGD
jgi:hypothetical protein